MDSHQKNEVLEGIAVVGMAGRFPGAGSVAELWRVVRDGVEAVSFLSDEEMIASGVSPAQVREPNYVRAKGVLEDAEMFDASFFGFSPREAELMDPQHRVFIECVWSALESAGYGSSARRPSSVALYGGVSLNTYLFNIFSNPGLLESFGFFHTMLANDRDYLTTRVSYELNLKGPSLNVQTGCSTSLVAVHLACQSLLDYQCDMALAGGVSVTVPKKSGYLYQPGGVASPDGHCRSFDAQAQGTVNGNGVGVVVLKRLEDALSDGDTILAVIRGSAINNDGSHKVGFTAPSVEGQAQVIAEAHTVAGVSADTISYVEAHGTGTVLGDPIEVAALTQAFRASTDRKNFCALGSIKPNVGHLDAAAGVTGLIKAVLTLRHRQIPASLNFTSPNPNIDFAESPFYVNAELREWERGETPRRAGVSSFGIGGTNAHVILEEAPPAKPAAPPARPCQLLTLSAKTEEALERATANLARFLRENPETNLADAAYTLHLGREEFAHRRAAVCSDTEDAARALETLDAKCVHTGMREEGAEVVMMFPGQGAQYVGMGRGLYETEEVFRREIDNCAELLRAELGFDLRALLFTDDAGAAGERLRQTSITQPALFVLEYALAKLWMGWGVKPAAMIGHSIGEYVAACLAGVFSLEDALRLVAARGRLMQSLPEGSMLAVTLPESEVVQMLAARGGETLSLAAVNAPSLCVVSGPEEALAEFERQLGERGVEGRRLHTSHAFHSEMMEPILARFVEEVRKVRLSAPRIPFVSNVTGTWITAEEATDPLYWARHLRQPVLFDAGMGELLRDGKRIFLEVGPGRTLSQLAKQQTESAPCALLSSLRHPHEQQSDSGFILQTLGQLWAAGVGVNWPALYPEERRRIPLPTYSFERSPYWLERQPPQPGAQQQLPTGKREDVADWFYVSAWRQSVAPERRAEDAASDDGPRRHCLIFADECGLGERLSEELRSQGREVAVVRAGEGFRRGDAGDYFVNPQRREDYVALLEDLRACGASPGVVAHLWSVTPSRGVQTSDEFVEQTQQRGFYSLLFLAQALGEQALAHAADGVTAVELCVVSNNLYAVTGDEEICPEKATVLGPSRVIAQEYPQITCRLVDVELSGPEAESARRVVKHLVAELEMNSDEPQVAYRGRRRWVQAFEPVRVEGGAPARLRERGAYLITGGAGGIGLALAESLAKTKSARLALVGRSALPPRAEWEAYLAERGAEDPLSRKIGKVRELEALGAEVLLLRADAANLDEMREAVGLARERFGRIDGVIHAAGLPGGGIIQLQTPETTHAVMSPKVAGTRVLYQLFAEEPPDFIALFSSHRSILGGVGRVEYAAANAYLDAFARALQNDGGAFVCSIIWDGWQEVGMAVEAARRLNLRPEDAIEAGMTTDEGVEAFMRALSCGRPEVVVSTQHFPALVEQSKAAAAASTLEEMGASRRSPQRHARPNVQTPYVAPTNEAERIIADIWQQLLGIEQVGIEDNFFELGGDSVLSIQIIAQAGKAGLRLTPQQIFHHQTIAELAAVAGTSQAVSAEQTAVSGDAPLTPIQHWFFDQQPPDAHHFNQALLLEVRESLDASLLGQAVAHLLAHHDALRMRFARGEEGWRQRNSPAGEAPPFTRLDLSTLPAAEQPAAIEAAAAEAQASLDLSGGPLMRVVFFDLGAGQPGRLLLVVHHLVVDAISWRFLLEDLANVYEQLRRGEQVSLAAKTTSFKHWAQRLESYAQTEAVECELDYWLADERRAVSPLPLDFAGGREANTEASSHTVRVALDAEETRALLQDVPQVYRTQINDVLLAALVRAFREWTGQDALLIDLEGHGRDAALEDVDVTRTVGWFTTVYPVLLQLDEAGSGEILKSVKEQLRRLPGRGLGYGLLRYLTRRPEVAEKLRAMPQADVSFLYLGQLDQALPESSPFAVARESSGPTASPRARRSHLLNVNGFVAGGQLQLDWTYSERAHRRSTVERLAETYAEALRGLIRHCLGGEGVGYTPSDFPDAELNQGELDELLAQLSLTG